jgi:hypothetical protein
MYKEAQAAPSPSPIGFIRAGAAAALVLSAKSGSRSKTFLTHSEVVGGVQDSVDFIRGQHHTVTIYRQKPKNAPNGLKI